MHPSCGRRGGRGLCRERRLRAQSQAKLFQFFAARGDLDTLARVADYTIARHDPALAGTPGRHLGLLQAVAARQARLVAQWLNVGFIHGVMNTDNMALSGETIDYGPCAFMDTYRSD